MKTVLLALFLFSILVQSCTQNSTPNGDYVTIKKAQAQNTIEGTLKASMTYDYQFSDQVQLTDKALFQAKHKDEILKTLEVVEKASIPGKDFILVFYRFSVGADIVRSTSYMKEIDGKWYIHANYYSSYSEDPFKNGKVAEGKALLERKDKWEEESEDIWWK